MTDDELVVKLTTQLAPPARRVGEDLAARVAELEAEIERLREVVAYYEQQQITVRGWLAQHPASPEQP